MPDDSVQVNPGAGKATYRAEDLVTLDFGDIVNDLLHGAAVPATVSFEVRWERSGDHFRLRDAANGFVGEFVEATASIEWSAQEATFSFVSDPASASTSVFAAVGNERNGVFFS